MYYYILLYSATAIYVQIVLRVVLFIKIIDSNSVTRLITGRDG